MDKSQYSHESEDERRETENKKYFQRFVEEVYSSDIHHSFCYMFAHIFEESRWTRCSVCLDINPFYGESFFVDLDERIDDIRKSRCDIYLVECFSRVCTKSTHRIRDFHSSDEAHDPVSHPLQISLKRTKMMIFPRISITYDYLCSSLENRTDEVVDSVSRVLVVSISIHDDISTEHESMHDPMMKGCSQTSICLEFYDVVDTEFSCHFCCPICTAIIDDEVFYLDAGDMLRQITKSHWKCLFFIFAGYLDNQLCHNYDSFGLETCSLFSSSGSVSIMKLTSAMSAPTLSATK